MCIAQIAPLAERVPPALYGGTERVVSALTGELVRRGHAVTLFASGDSLTAATLVPSTPRALRLDPTIADTYAYTLLQLGTVFDRAGSSTSSTTTSTTSPGRSHARPARRW
jgi:hypothetical protein